jgi:UDP-2-acetamido-3-amino-2,3-dideoxy-glucuronate N-acetyltransferase
MFKEVYMNQISSSAKIGRNVNIGFFTVIMDDVEIGDNSVIGNHVVIYPNTVIGAGVRIDDGAVLGKLPMRAVNSTLKLYATLPPAIIGAGSIIGTYGIVYRGAKLDEGVMVADGASVREGTSIGQHTIIGRSVTVENSSYVGEYCKIETGAYITAYSHIEDHVFVAPGVVTSNDNFAGRTKDRSKYYRGVTVEQGGRIGAQATILPGKVIGADGFVGAGSVLTHDADSGMVYTGNPAKKLRPVPEAELLKNQDYMEEKDHAQKGSNDSFKRIQE